MMAIETLYLTYEEAYRALFDPFKTAADWNGRFRRWVAADRAFLAEYRKLRSWDQTLWDYRKRLSELGAEAREAIRA